MNIADYLLIAIVVLSAVIGAMRGFLREAVSVASWVAALFLAWHYSASLEPHLGAVLAQHPQARTWVARLIILMVVLSIGALVAGLLGHFVRLSIFSGLDRFLGVCFGAARGLLAIGALVIAGQMLQLDAEQWWRKSTLMPQAMQIANGLRIIVGEHWRPKEISV
jgi:membrane protein required for colicin V production